MVFIHNGWTLYCLDMTLRGGKKQTVYFFSMKKPKRGKSCDMPPGYRIKEGRQVGSCMPYLTKH